MASIVRGVGLAVVAVLATSAVASASPHFTATSYPSEFFGKNGKGTELFETEAGSVECESVFEGTIGFASSTVEAHAEYANCAAFGYLSAEVDTEECNYLFHVESGSGPGFGGSVSVVCPEGQSIKITAPKCAAEVPSQGPLGAVDFTNASGAIEVVATVVEIEYVVTEDGFLCPFKGTGAKAGGTYTSNEPVSISSSASLEIA